MVSISILPDAAKVLAWLIRQNMYDVLIVHKYAYLDGEIGI